MINNFTEKGGKLEAVADKLRDFVDSENPITIGAGIVGTLSTVVGALAFVGDIAGITNLSHYPSSHLFNIDGTKITYFSAGNLAVGLGIFTLQQIIPRIAARGLEYTSLKLQHKGRRR